MTDPGYFEGTSFGQEALKVVGQAFDEAWSTIAPNFDGDDHIELARLKLAHAILSVATGDRLDVTALKRAGLEAMALRYRSLMDSQKSAGSSQARSL